MTEKKQQQDPAYLRPRGVFWRSVGALLVFQAVGWGCAAGLAYLIITPELAKDYFSAHSTVKATWELVVPALAVSAAVGFLVVGAGSALGLWSHSRRVLEPLRRMDGLVRGLGAGRLPRTDPAAEAPAVDAEFAAAVEPLRARVQELQRITRELQHLSLDLNYRSGGAAPITLRDLRELAGQFDELSKDLSRTAGWFEG